MKTIHWLLVLMLAIQVIRYVMYDRVEHPVQEDFQHILIINGHCAGEKYRQSGVLVQRFLQTVTVAYRHGQRFFGYDIKLATIPGKNSISPNSCSSHSIAPS